MSASDLIEAQKSARGVVGNILRRRPDDVDDVLQNAALKAWKRKATFRGESSLRSWFTRIAINEAIMLLRRKERRNDSIEEPGVLQTLICQLETPEESAIRLESNARLYRAIFQLSPTMRSGALGIMRGEEGISPKVKARRHRAKLKLRQLLESAA